MTDINKIKKADNGSIIIGTTPIGNGRLKQNFNVSPLINILNDTKERIIMLKKEKTTDIKGSKCPFNNKDIIPPKKIKKIPTKNKIIIFVFGEI